MKTSSLTVSRPRDWEGLIGWLVFSLAAAWTSLFVSTGGWYESLDKPAWNPPSAVFGPVWTVLYVLIGLAAWLVWREGGWKAQWKPLSLFLVQWILNTAWTPLFFGLHQPGWALFELIVLWGLAVATGIAFWRVRQLAGVLWLPYLLWLTFAVALNFSIWRLNTL
ncbi:MAG TPA: TspO/MBR family protein [Chthoniobacteraceae bacterium]|nr:TspO/MBR family protein [Chthoniobacteraceae bacterium]